MGADAARMPAAPSPRRFAAAALASMVAVFGVLALRLHDGDDPGLAASSSSATQSVTTASQSSDSSTSSDPGAVSSTPSASTSAS
jgi:hypothetical protein